MAVRIVEVDRPRTVGNRTGRVHEFEPGDPQFVVSCSDASDSEYDFDGRSALRCSSCEIAAEGEGHAAAIKERKILESSGKR